MGSPVPDSILPPPPRIRPGAKAALIALVITVPLAVAGVYLSFYLAHGASFAERAIAVAVFWPALVVLALLGTLSAPELLLNVLSFGAEFLYVWGIVRLTKVVAHGR